MTRVLPLLAALAAAPLAGTPSLPDWARVGAPAAPPPSAVTTPGVPSGPPVQSVPLDGGLGLLALAGGAYAARRLRGRGRTRPGVP